MSEWQPIETAPRDGTWILASCVGQLIPMVAAFDDDDDSMCWFSFNLVYERAVRHGEPERKFKPTHWMPLPEPPR
jgi:hypothetical protein